MNSLSLQQRTSAQTDFFLRLAEILGGTHKSTRKERWKKHNFLFIFGQSTEISISDEK